MSKKIAVVVINKALNTEQKYILEDGKEVLVGADSEASVVVDDEFISSRHFSLELVNGSVVAADRGSTNGLYLRLDKPARILPGQTLLAGKTVFRLEEEEACLESEERQQDSTQAEVM